MLYWSCNPQYVWNDVRCISITKSEQLLAENPLKALPCALAGVGPIITSEKYTESVWQKNHED